MRHSATPDELPAMATGKASAPNGRNTPGGEAKQRMYGGRFMAAWKAWSVQVGRGLFTANREAFHAVGLDANSDKDFLRDLGLYEIVGDVP